MVGPLLCPQCNSKAYKRNGYTRHGKQNYRCLDCGRQFSHEPSATPKEQLKAELHAVTQIPYHLEAISDSPNLAQMVNYSPVIAL